jgi:hypothetical protein
MDITLLTFDGCPNGKPARVLVQQTLAELGLKVEIRTVVIKNEVQAAEHRFLGSPTIQINGRDIEVQRRSDEASFSCRMYQTREGSSGIPPKELLLAALNEAREE